MTRLGTTARAAAVAFWLLALASPASGQLTPPLPGQKPGFEVCQKQGEPTPEIYGPTDIGATLGNGRLSVAVNPQGTLSVLKWPSPSYYDQLKYFTVDRGLPRLGLYPNEGAFSGLALRLRDGSTPTLWLRDLPASQRYRSEDSDTVHTRFRSARHRFSLDLIDVVPQGADVLLRSHLLRLERGSPVRSARLVAFANLQPKATKVAFFPTLDWCTEVTNTDVARYDSTADAIVYSISGVDQSVQRQRSVAVAIGASRPSDGHQTGADHYAGSASSGPASAYDDAADGQLQGNSALGPAEVDTALSVPIGRRPVSVIFAAAPTTASATALLDRYRARSPAREAAAKRRSSLRWLRRAPLPRRAPRSVVRLAKRALITLRQATDEHAGEDGRKVAIVAAIATQSPYGEDWIRDGAFFNEALDEIGHPELVERHNAFYSEVQKKNGPPGSPLTICFQPTPAGMWVMNNYADGPEGAPIPWEIDEAGFGPYLLWRHYERRPDAAGRAALRPYLESAYPAIRRAADFLVAFRDPLTGLTPPGACEDDNYPNPATAPTMHAEGPVLLGLRSAAAAARALGRSDDAQRYEARAQELERATDARFSLPGGAWTRSSEDGGWALWPVELRAYSDPRMRAQAEAVWRDLEPSFLAPGGPRQRGQYESKGLLGLAHAYRAVDPAGLARVRRGLRWIAETQAAYQRTGILGESWYVRNGRLLSVVSQPHVWEQVLFYLAAIEAYGRSPYRAARSGALPRAKVRR